MAYNANPFLERRSERTKSDQEFVRLYSPKMLERLDEDTFIGAVHVFRSPPGGGKTTLLRSFTPGVLRAFWNARHVPEMAESVQRLASRNVLSVQEGPQVLGVLLSFASGYADLPPGAVASSHNLFRALVDCRIILRSLRSLAVFLSKSSTEEMEDVRIEYDESAKDLIAVPATSSVSDLVRWAESQERAVYKKLENGENDVESSLSHLRFEGVLWLQSVRFLHDGKIVAPNRLLMIDDVHKLRRLQRLLFIQELTEMRPSIPVWLAERSIVLGDELLSPGAREGRDLFEHELEELWTNSRGQHQFIAFAQNILDRRMDTQSLIPAGAFSQYLRSQFQREEYRPEISRGVEKFRSDTERLKENPRYSEWLARAEASLNSPDIEALRELYVTRILLVRDLGKRQMALDLGPLPAQELDDRDSSSVQGAAEVFIHEELKLPFYFGIERLCVMATNNIEELLAMAAALYEGLLAKQILRKPEILLSPAEQERLLKETAKRKRDFIPKNHTEGARAQKLLDATGSFCRDRTFLPNAPYAPGVTGIRLSALGHALIK
ncbi:MAG: hypothetical protein P4M05_26390 [Bradyrhizobium sp.]|nr:hypothetical protein [Bradyrhizobium sp.]